MKIRMAHLHKQGIDFAVFEANSSAGNDSGRAQVLASLTNQARANGLKVDKSALVYDQNGSTRFYGTPDLVRFLSSNWIPVWTHTIDIQAL